VVTRKLAPVSGCPEWQEVVLIVVVRCLIVLCVMVCAGEVTGSWVVVRTVVETGTGSVVTGSSVESMDDVKFRA
jgi:hypothetical protein